MSWTRYSEEDWLEVVSDEIDQLDSPAGRSLARFNLVPHGFEGKGTIHRGSLRMEGDFVFPSELTVVLGDLEVSGRISTQDVDGADGNITLLVLGNLRCATLVNDWASLILVSKDARVSAWAFTGREDSSFVVGGDFETPLFVGYDIWVSVGGTARMEAGIGYAVQLGPDGIEDFNRTIQPLLGREATERMLHLNEGETPDKRLYDTGTILPQD